MEFCQKQFRLFETMGSIVSISKHKVEFDQETSLNTKSNHDFLRSAVWLEEDPYSEHNDLLCLQSSDRNQASRIKHKCVVNFVDSADDPNIFEKKCHTQVLRSYNSIDGFNLASYREKRFVRCSSCMDSRNTPKLTADDAEVGRSTTCCPTDSSEKKCSSRRLQPLPSSIQAKVSSISNNSSKTQK